MAEVLPVIYTVEHASYDFGEFSNRTRLSNTQKLRFSDYGTVDTVPANGMVIVGSKSRALVDLNRAPNAPDLFPKVDFAKPRPNRIWKYGYSLLQDERIQNFNTIYRPYHDEILQSIRSFGKKPVLLVSWHNTAHYEIGRDETGNTQIMKPVILSNRGDENRADSTNGITSCDPGLLEFLAQILRVKLQETDLPDDVYLNFVLKGGYVTEHYNSRRHPDLFNKSANVQSLQVEYDTKITHNQDSLAPNYKKMRELKRVFEETITDTYKEFYH